MIDINNSFHSTHRPDSSLCNFFQRVPNLGQINRTTKEKIKHLNRNFFNHDLSIAFEQRLNKSNEDLSIYKENLLEFKPKAEEAIKKEENERKKINLKQFLIDKKQFDATVKSKSSQVQEVMMKFFKNRDSIKPNINLKNLIISRRTSSILNIKSGKETNTTMRQSNKPDSIIKKNCLNKTTSTSSPSYKSRVDNTLNNLTKRCNMKVEHNLSARVSNKATITKISKITKSDKSIQKVRDCRLDENGDEIIFRGRYKIDKNFWLNKLEQREEKVKAQEKKHKEFLKFLSSLNKNQTLLYWNDQKRDIEEKFNKLSFDSVINEWKKITPTWRNTRVPDKLLYLKMIDIEHKDFNNFVSNKFN